MIGKILWRRYRPPTPILLGFPCGSSGKESTCNVRDLGSIPGSGRLFGGGFGNSFQYSRLENPRGQRSLVGDSPEGRTESNTTEQQSTAQLYLWFSSCVSQTSSISVSITHELVRNTNVQVSPSLLKDRNHGGWGSAICV